MSATSARTQVLDRIAQANRLAGRPTSGAVERDYRDANHSWETELNADQLAGLLVERLEDYGARVWQVTQSEVPDAVAQALGNETRVVVPPRLPAAWLGKWESAGTQVAKDSARQPLTTAQLDQCQAVVTEATVAIAETGTLVLQGGAGQGRRALSLVVDHHVCVLRRDRISRGVPGGLARLDPLKPITMISGPSATADIELERVQGVHGPRRLDVVIYH